MLFCVHAVHAVLSDMLELIGCSYGCVMHEGESILLL